jgi:uncharacterized protein involved in exopolysaccharide biosynthesis
LEGEIKSLHSRIKQLKGEIEELKALDDEELKKLAKTEEVQVLEANMHVLKRQLDFERANGPNYRGSTRN